MLAQRESANKKHIIFVVLVYILLASATAAWGRLHGYAFIQIGPSFQIAATAKSLWNSGRLEREGLRDIYNLQLEKSRKDPHNTYWQDIFSLGKGGQLYPIRSVFLSYIAAPFYGALGDFGFWVLEQSIYVAILISFYCLASALSSAEGGLIMSLSLMGGTYLLRFSYILSYDVFAVCLIIAGLWLLRRFPFWGSLIMTASIETRPTNSLYLIFLFFAWMPYYSNRKQAITAIASGALLSCAGIMLMNYILWGGPMISGFQRKLAFINGHAVIEPPIFFFNLRTLASNWGEKLVGNSGLLRSSPVVIGFPIAFISTFRSKFRWFHTTAILAIVVHILMVYGLSNWADLDNAPRYLLVAIVLMVLAYASLLERFRLAEPKSVVAERD